MASLWPWLAVAGAGALHGLNPANGWACAAAWGLRSRDGAQALRALLPVAIGHAASIALVAGAVVWGLAMDRFAPQVFAGGLLAVCVVLHLWRRAPRVARAPAGHAGLALWSFMMTGAQGAGLMLVPALVPLCAGGASLAGMDGVGPLSLALAALVVHTSAMLVVTGLVASGVCRGVEAGVPWLGRLRDLAEQAKQAVKRQQGRQHQHAGLDAAATDQSSDHAAGQDGAEDVSCFHGLDGNALLGSIDVSVTYDTPPFGLSLSKPFDKLRANGSHVSVLIYENLNKPAKAAAQAASRRAAGWR